MLGTLKLALKSRQDRQAQQREIQRLAQELEQSQQYSFTADWMSYQVENWRQDFARLAGRPGLRMLEIGSYEGRSAVWFLENILTHPDSRIVCVDPFYDPLREMRFDHNVKFSRAQARLEKHRARSEAVLPRLERASFDLIYVDGSHDAPFVLLDAMLSWELLKPGGILAFDDYEWEPQLPPESRPKLAIDLFLASHAGRYNLLRQAYQVVIEKKEGS
ncbi:MAG TPA: class I SAM-dependent methyltransferase [Bryobacteraceae bacterium]|nr:class I SAM-dependent methyltransferase [Bryobacteraceae bacterium]